MVNKNKTNILFRPIRRKSHKRKPTAQNHQTHIELKTVIFIGVSFAIGGYIGLVVGYNIPKSNNSTVAQDLITLDESIEVYTHDPYLASRMDALRLDYSKLNLIRGPNPVIPDAKASFTGPNSLYIGDVREDIFDRVIMHEYIHYIQATDAEAVLFKPYMYELLAGNATFNERMEPYRSNQHCTSNCISFEFEAQAVACTELPDNQLRADFAAWCTKHIPHRLK